MAMVATVNGTAHGIYTMNGSNGHEQMLSSSSTSSSSTSLSSMYQAHVAASSDTDTASLMDDNASLYPAVFCRAKYDYVAQDASALSFQTGDIIEVLTQQPSGWWDGLLNDERGWFPSNYVTLITEEEAEREFEERYGTQNQTQSGAVGLGQAAGVSTAAASASVNRQSVVDMGQALMGSSPSLGAEDTEVWLANALQNDSHSAHGNPPSASDFWMPQVAPNGQIFYVNTKTGEQSRDLPQESDEEISSDSDLGTALNHTSNSRGFGGEQLNHLGQLGNLTSHLSFGIGTPSVPSGFGVPRRTGTPEPWVRRLADDGLSHYYYNKIDGSVQWTRPEGTSPNTPTTAVPTRGGKSGVRPNSVYSDTSEINPVDFNDAPRHRGHAHSSSVTTATAVGSSSHQNHVTQLTAAEIIAHSLQESLLPPPPQSPLELGAVARDAIGAVVERLDLDNIINMKTLGSSHEREFDVLDQLVLRAMEGMDELIQNVVQSVRDLLYVSAVPASSIPSSVLPKGYTPPYAQKSSQNSGSHTRTHDRSHSYSSSHPNAPLKPAQRKVTATLSRLVLSARAIAYDSGSQSPSRTAERIRSDAEELDNAVAAFVVNVQKLLRTQQTQPRELQQLGRKRLKAAFDVQNLGLGLPGAGVGGGWRGFGWISSDEEVEMDVEVGASPTSPSKPLSTDVIAEVAASITRLDALLGVLMMAVQSPDGNKGDPESNEFSVEHIHSFGRDVLAQIQTILGLVEDIDLAESVVIDTPSSLNSNPPPTSTGGEASELSGLASISSSSLSGASTSSSNFGSSFSGSSSSSVASSSTFPSKPNGTAVASHSRLTRVNEAYDHAILSARTLLRSFEAAVQSLYDDASSLFNQLQLLRSDPLSSISSLAPSSTSISFSLHHERDLCLDVVNVLCTSLKANSAVMLQDMERLLTVGAEQKEEVGMKEWEGSVRFSREVSRRSLVRSSMFDGIGGINGGRPSSVLRAPMEYGYEFDELPSALQPGYGMSPSMDGIAGAPDDEVGLEDAFSRPQRTMRIEPNRYQGPQSPDVYGVPTGQTQPGPTKPQQTSTIPLQSRSVGGVKLLPTITNNAPHFNRIEGYNQRNGMGFTGTGTIIGNTYREVSQQESASESEPSYGGMTSSASEGEDFSELGDEEDYEVGFDKEGIELGDDPLTPTPNTPSKRTKAGKISNKAAKILGDEAPPWFLLPNEGGIGKDIIVDSDKSVKGGTVAALVERLTAHDTTDPNYSKAFLMTFKSFTTLDELFELLVQRFRIQAPEGLTGLDLKLWTGKKKNIVQFRVINTFKSMLTDEDILEKDDLYILGRMKEFVQSEDVAQVNASKPLLALIERVQKSGETKRIVVKAAQAVPASILPKGVSLTSTGKKLKLTDIEPLELARQFTLLESSLYQKIRPMECLQRAREGSKGDKGDGSLMDNIALVIQTSNRIADWVAENVLSKEDSKKRATAVKHLIQVADRCRVLNNFSTMIAIVSGLNTPPIRRLKRTWEQVSQRHMAQFGDCEVTLDSNRNFTKYRSMLAAVVPPCVPFIGVFLSTLQFIQDGNKDFLSEGMVNFKKRQMASEVISDIKRWQSHSYNLQVVPPIREYIDESLSAFDDTRMSSDRFWQMSLEREPREREDEKMARLLQESGFL